MVLHEIKCNFNLHRRSGFRCGRQVVLGEMLQIGHDIKKLMERDDMLKERL